MRVSDRQFTDLSSQWIDRARVDAHEAAERVQSGRRVLRPSDDPAGSAAAVRESMQIRRQEATLGTVRQSRLVTESSEATLDGVNSILARLGELAVQAANDTLTPGDRASIAVEVAALREQLLSLANTQTSGSYVFGGFADGSAPFAGDGTYVGSQAAQEIEVAPGVRVPVGLTGQDVFAPPGGVDLFQAVDAFRAALETDDVDGVRQAIDDVATAGAQVADARARLGATIDAFLTAESVLERSRDEAVARRSEHVDAGVRELVEYTQAQQAVETAVTIASQLPLAGLVGRG